MEVVINAKAENLGEVIEAPAQGLGEEAVQEKLKEVPKKDFVVIDGSNSSIDILNRLTSVWQVDPKEIRVRVGGKWLPSAKKRVTHFGYSLSEEKPSVELGVVDGVLVRSIPGLRDGGVHGAG